MLQKHAFVSAFPRPCTTLASLAMLAVASPVLAQSPSLETRVFATTDQGHPMRLPAGVYIQYAARFDDRYAILSAGSQTYLSDGVTFSPIMAPSTQIPGQPPGVVWGPRLWSWPDVWPLDDRGAQFAGYASGPGIGDEPRLMHILGHPLAGPLLLSPRSSTSIQVTRTGLTASYTDGSLAVGPYEGPHTVVIPLGYRPEGFSSPALLRTEPRLNIHGAVAAAYTVPSGGLPIHVILTADASSIRTLAAGRSTLSTDRGDFALTETVEPFSCPAEDGSVFIRGFQRPGFAPLLWNAHPSGRNALVAAVGERAPGTAPGVTFSDVTGIAGNLRGSCVFTAELQGPGVTPDNKVAVYFWRNGRATLVARSTPDSPLERFPARSITLTADDRVAVVVFTRAVLFTPATGSITIAKRGEPVHPDIGLRGAVVQTTTFYGSLFEYMIVGSSDEAKIPCVSPDGELFLAIATEDPDVQSNLIGVRISSPGCPADFNNDGFSDFFDYADFIECFEGGRCPDGRNADFNHDDFDDFFDYTDFVTAFETGC